MIKIQSISDIITNSSSEVFVIETDKHSQVADFIKSVCDLFGIDMDEIMEIAKKGHALYPRLAFIAWDFCVDENGEVVVW